MGKRSNFARVDRDLYNTPAKAVQPLLRWLEPGTEFLEPCYGQGALAAALKAAGHRFCGGFDLPLDARKQCYGVRSGEIFITNPPYWGKPKDLHPLILNLSNQAPTWLLMPADWLFNQSSSSLTTRLAMVVAIGRVRWIPGSRSDGKDNVAWLLFDRRATGAQFIGREPAHARTTKGSAGVSPRRADQGG